MKFRASIAAGLLAALIFPGAVSAADLYWYPSHPAQGGGGAWNTTSAFWNPNADGSGTQAAWNNATFDAAIFGGTAGTVTNASGITAGSLQFLTTGYVITNSGLANTLTLSGGTGVINVGSGMTANIRGSLSSSSLITKTGTGTLALGGASAPNNIAGGIYLQEGELRTLSGTSGMLGTTTLRMANGTTVATTFGGSSSIGPTLASAGDGYQINNGATVTFNIDLAGSASTGNSRFAGDASYGNGVTLIKTGQGTMVLGTTSANFGSTSANTWRIDQGLVQFTDTAAFGASANGITLNGGGIRLGNTSRTLANPFTLNDVAGNRIEVLGTLTLGTANQLTGTGGFSKTETGTLSITASNSYSGTTTLSNGTLLGGNDNAFGTGALALNAGTIASSSSVARTFSNALTIGGDITFGQTSGGTGTLLFASTATNNLGAATRTLTVNQATDIRGAIGNGNITKAGDATLTLANSSSSFGALTINAGSVVVSNGATVTGLAGTGGLNITNSTLTVNSGTASSFGGAISGSGSLAKTGSGTVTLTGDNTFTGATAVIGGTLELNASSGAALGATTSIGVTNAVLLVSKSDQVNNVAISLSGGTIQRGSGVSEVFGNLNIAAASFLDFGSGTAGTLQFQNYSNTGSSLVTVQNFFPGNKLQFTSTSFGTGDLANFSFSSVYTTGTVGGYFTITAIPETSTVVAAIGLAGMMFWPARRRLMRDAKSILGIRRSARDRMRQYGRS